jgi:hypothetical protein
LLGRRQARSVAALAVGLALVSSAACNTDRKVTEPPPEKITDELLSDQLIKAAAVGAAFTETTADNPIDTEVLKDAGCDDKLKDVEAKAAADATFEGEGVTVINQLAYLPGSGGAFESMLDDIYDDCAKVVVAKKGESIRTLPLQFGSLTDDTKAFKFEIESDDGPIQESDYILIRKGDLVSVVRLDGTRPIDTAITDRAVRQAIGNLGTLDNET